MDSVLYGNCSLTGCEKSNSNPRRNLVREHMRGADHQQNNMFGINILGSLNRSLNAV
jgi:hypothetical protein